MFELMLSQMFNSNSQTSITLKLMNQTNTKPSTYNFIQASVVGKLYYNSKT